jgi:hypothetical protein
MWRRGFPVFSRDTRQVIANGNGTTRTPADGQSPSKSGAASSHLVPFKLIRQDAPSLSSFFGGSSVQV